jgi:hypothetical protein
MSELLVESAPVTTVGVDRERVLVLRRETGDVVVLDRIAAAVLRTLHGRQSVDEHAAAAWRSGVSDRPAAIATAINKLWALDLLKPGGDVEQLAPREHISRPIDTVAIITADRPAMLQRSLQYLTEQLEGLSHIPRVIVVDGSRSTANREKTQACAVESAREIRLQYVGPTQAERIWLSLASAIGGPSPRDMATTAGAIGTNRNIVSLLTAGEQVLTLDDDVSCRPWQRPDAEAGIQLAGHSDPREWEFFGTRNEALTGLVPAPVNIVAAHAELLGMPLSALFTPGTHGGTVSLGEACSHILAALNTDSPGRVRVTFAGLAGDSARYCPDRLLQLSGNVTKVLCSSQQAFDTALASREVRRVARRATVTHNCACMSYCMGLQNSSLLPPFMPAGRNEDGVFGEMLAFADPTALFAHLPVGVIHDSDRASAYGHERRLSARVTRMSDIVLCALRVAARSIAAQGTGDRLRRLGQLLVDLGRQPARDFELFVKENILSARSYEMATLAARMAQQQLPRYFQAAVADYQREFMDSVVAPGFFVPTEFVSSVASEEWFQLSQEFLHGYGRLLMWWPDLWQCAAERHDQLEAIAAESDDRRMGIV